MRYPSTIFGEHMKNSVAIESLRAWMAWLVVLDHAQYLCGGQQILHPLLYKLVSNGALAVSVFIIISGFVITNLLIVRKERYFPYILRRAFRIFPIYLFCIFIAIFVSGLYYAAYLTPEWVPNNDMRLDRMASEHNFYVEHLLLHMSMMHGILPDTIFPFSSVAFLAPAWSLSLEWQFYMLAPFLISLLSKRITVMLATTFLLLAMNVALRTSYFGEWEFNSFLPLAIQYFLIGIFSRLALEYLPLKRMPPELLFVAGATAAIFASKPAILIWITFFTIVLYEQGYFARASKPFSLFARLIALNPYVSTIGKWSYSTYLIHIPIFAIIVGGAIKIYGPQSQTNYVVLLALCMPIIFVVSFVLYRFIETPFIDLGRRLTSRASTTPSLPAVSG